MAFKKVKDYNEEKFGGLFRLQNDGDYADVIFMYRSEDDVLVADTHYIKSADYTGYVHCCGRGCAACGKGIRVQTKLFIPMYNIQANEIQFFDRTMRFEPQLQQDVFSKYPNPSEYVFRITRHGAAGDVNTTYQIVAIARNNIKSYDQICAEQKAVFPDYYEHICKEIDNGTLYSMLNTAQDEVTSTSSDMPEYQIKPRTVVPESSIPEVPEIDEPDVVDSETELAEPEF